MVDAAQAILFIATEEQRSAPMRAIVLDQADLVGCRAEGDQLLAEQLDADWRAIRHRSFIRFHHRQPVLAEQITHQRPWPDSTEELVFFLTQHRSSLLLDTLAVRVQAYASKLNPYTSLGAIGSPSLSRP